MILILRGDVAGAPPAAWLTGRALRQHLAEPIDLFWSGVPLRSALGSVSRTHRVAVFLDPRVDPGQKMELALRDLSLLQALQSAADQQNLGVTWLESVAYLGPPDVAAKLRTLAALRTEDLQTFPPPVKMKFLARAPLAWDDFAEPRELLQRLARESGLSVDGWQQIPYDLWAAADLPPLTLVGRLTLLLAPWDRTFEITSGGSRLKLVPIPEDPVLEGSYPGGSRPEEEARRFAALAPGARIRIAGKQIVVRGRVEDHERITGTGETEDRGSSASGLVALADKRFTLTVKEKPIGPLLQQLAAQIGLQLQIDSEALRRAGVSLDKRVSFRVKEATIDQLLQAAVQNIPVRCRRQGTVVVIEPN
jgi:hypothetical protein